MKNIALLLLTFSVIGCHAVTAAVTVPNPTIDEVLATAKGERVAVLAGGCFWGVEAVFEHVKGVKDVVSGYAGGNRSEADYYTVSSGRTGHAESVQIVYDPSQITLGQLLKVFFSVAHDPTQLNRQGPDEGPQYRSAIFAGNEEQERIAKAYVKQLNEAKVFGDPVVTEVGPLKGFYKAEDYHQDFVVHNPSHPYVMFHDLPKLSKLRKEFPDLYK
jgi:peptide-methionine (S)-S-oxide reductase